MNRYGKLFRPLTWLMAILLAAFVAACGGGGGSGSAPAGGTGPAPTPVNAAGAVCDPAVSLAPACVSLATAGTYVILTKAGVTNVPTSAVTGDIGVSPIDSTAITGFSPTMDASGTFSTSSQVTGKIYASDYAAPTPANLTAAVGDVNTAYGDASSRAPADTNLGAGSIGGLTIAPGVHKWTTGIAINTDVTLSGSATDVWIMQTTGGITQANDTHVLLTGGALPQNVFWQTVGVAAIGTHADFSGIVLSGSSITVGTGASIHGRLYANTSVTLDTNTVTRPGS